MKDKLDKFKELIDDAKSIVIIQADNPDGDSLGSALALEEILGDLGKQTYLYCRIDIPSYLKYLKGWDRVYRELPKNFDLSIVVDCSSLTLLGNSQKNGDLKKLSSKPFIVLDHHLEGDKLIPFATLEIIENVPATGELIYLIAKELKYDINLEAAKAISVAIMSDTLGLVSQTTTSTTIRIIADLVDLGVDLTFLDDARRELSRKSVELIKYKAKLLERIEFYRDNRIACLVIPWEEIKQYSSEYNPPMLVLDDMRGVIGGQVAIAFKVYNDGHITAKIRSNISAPISKKIAEHFGGDGHVFASGFKIEGSEAITIERIKSETIQYTQKLLDSIDS